MRVTRKGYGCTNARTILERVHRFNRQHREPKDNTEVGERELEYRTFDLKDFFTNVDRVQFAEDLRKIMAELRHANQGAEYF